MDFLKKHYEKLVLGLVLVGLAVAVAFLPIKIASDKQAQEDQKTALIHPKVKPLTNLDLTLPETALKRMATVETIDFGPPNKLFNPMPWQQTADKRLIRSDKVGLSAITVTNVNPLYLKLTLDSVTVSDSGAKYVIGVEKQAAAQATQRAKKQTYCKLNDKNDTFQLVEVKGKPEEPSQLIVLLNDTGERGVITKEQPFKRVDGYMADLRYDLEKKTWTNRRANSQPPLIFNGEEYNIVAISQTEVVLSAKSNQKKWTIKANLNGTP
ncbi:MAG TPA: hypothetical protein VNZ22_18040 [Bacillota bacterium]|nr:hypothetical protein [Bacillota bacterium]